MCINALYQNLAFHFNFQQFEKFSFSWVTTGVVMVMEKVCLLRYNKSKRWVLTGTFGISNTSSLEFYAYMYDSKCKYMNWLVIVFDSITTTMLCDVCLEAPKALNEKVKESVFGEIIIYPWNIKEYTKLLSSKNITTFVKSNHVWNAFSITD